MGQFSWDCHVCSKSMRRMWPGSKPRDAYREDVVLVPETGDRMEGKYDGYGRVDDVRIPETWDKSGVDVVVLLGKIAADERQARELRAEADECWEEAKRSGRDTYKRLSTTYHDAASLLETKIKHDRWMVDYAKEDVRFTAYHRRCWEDAGRPGFREQSRRSEDQGA